MKATAIILGIVFIAGAAYWMVSSLFVTHRSQPIDIPSFATTASYQCANGKSFLMALSGDIVSLVFDDGRKFSVRKVQAGLSDVTYENAANGVIFWASGKDAYIAEKEVQTYRDCVIDTTKAQDAARADSAFQAR